MIKKIALFSLIFLASCITFSQKTYKIKGKINNLKSEKVYLGTYTGKNLYFYDTADVNADGSFTFINKDMPHGVYAVIASLDPPNYFDFLVNETNIEFETTFPNLVPSMKIKKSKENKAFFTYINFLKQNADRKKPLLEKRKVAIDSSDKKTAKKLEEEIIEIDNNVKKYQENLYKTKSDMLVGKLVGMSVEPKMANAPKGMKDTAQFKFDYYKNHFWDNIDLNDDRLGKSALFYNQMQTYFTKVIPQIPDSIIFRIDQFLNKLKPNGFMMKSAVEFLAYAHAKTKIMGMDGVYVHVADNYILNGRSEWISKDKRDKLKPKVDKLRPCLIGKTAQNITLADTSEKKWINLTKDVKHDFTLLIFWADDCGHCKKEIPKYKKLYDSIKKNTDIDFEVYAVCTSVENEGWKKFIDKHNLDWINVSDFQDMRDHPEQYTILDRRTDMKSINYRNTYDVFVTPIGYLLDENKKIIAKQFDSNQLRDLIKIFQDRKDEKNK